MYVLLSNNFQLRSTAFIFRLCNPDIDPVTSDASDKEHRVPETHFNVGIVSVLFASI